MSGLCSGGGGGGKTYKVVMVRHGESLYNVENKFCGWFDADLAPSGFEEAINAGNVGLYI